MRISHALPLLFAMSIVLTACEHNTDLVAKLNAQPFGNINDANIAIMVANPADLVHGRGGGTVGSATTVLPIERLETDHPKLLRSPGGGSSGGSGGGSGGGSADAGGAGGSGG